MKIAEVEETLGVADDERSDLEKFLIQKLADSKRQKVVMQRTEVEGLLTEIDKLRAEARAKNRAELFSASPAPDLFNNIAAPLDNNQ